MKDMIGRDISVGDTVAYASDRIYPQLTIGTVLGVHKSGMLVKRLHSGNDVRDGMYLEQKWDHQARELKTNITDKVAHKTWVCCSERVYIINKKG